MPKLIYYGFWFSPEREMLQAAIDKSQEFVSGRVRLKLYKGNVGVVGRESKYSLYDQDLVTFEDGKVAYDQRDAEGFIRLNALRLRTLGQRKNEAEADSREGAALRRPVTHGLDIMAVGIEHEGAVVVRVIVWAQAGRTMVLAAGRDGGAIEGIDRCAILRDERHVQPAAERVAGTDPEIGLTLVAEPGRGLAAALLRRHLHHDAVAERRQRSFVEFLRAGKIRHPEADVVEHAYTCRSTSVRLRSAMTFAGLRCFGQALEQFRMVWQR